MSKALLTLGLGLCLSATVSAQSISVGSASGSPGGGTTPALVPVTFTRNPASAVADFIVRVNFNNTNLTATAAAINGGGCSVNPGGFVTVLPPAGLSDVQTNTYCNITFTIAPAAPAPSTQNLTLAFAPGGACIDSNADPVACTLSNGAITVTAVVGDTPPVIAYNPATGTTITYAGAGTASPIVATPSGGTGSGAAATTTVGACAITGGNAAAFPVSNIAQLSFVGPTTTAQNINLPNCVPQAAAVNATLTCPETRGAGAAVNRVWTLTCPAAAVVAVPPTITYAPAPGSSTNVAAGSNTTINVGCPTDGAACNGSGTGLAATSRLEGLVANYAGPAFSPLPTMVCAFVTEAGGAAASPLDFVAGAADAGDIRCACPLNTTGLPNEPFTVSVNERIPASSGAITATRNFTIVCGGPPPVCPPPTYVNQAPGSTINLTNGGAASIVTNVSLVGASNGVNQTIVCATSNVSAGSTFTVTTNPTPLVVSTTPALGGTVSASCTNSATTTGTATLTCVGSSTTPNCASTNTFTLSCPGQNEPPPPGVSIPVPTLSEQGRILLAALVLLLGLGVVGFRMRG